MANRRRAKITALGRYVPPRVVTNHELSKMVETNHDWIVERTGIYERHWVENGAPTSELAVKAADDLLKRRGIEAHEIELIIVATVTPDMFFPSTACLIQNKIRATRAWGFDISAACSSFLYALTTGAQFIESGQHKKVLVVGADVMTSILNAGRRQSQSFVARDRGQEDALRPPKRSGCLQIRSAQDGGAEQIDAGKEQPDRRGDRRVHR